MFSYVLNKIRNKKWMSISLVIGNVLLIGLVVGIMVYSNAVLNRMLIKDLNISMEETGIYPLQTYVEIRMDRTRSDKSVARKVKELEELNEELPYRMNLTPKEMISNYYIRTNYLFNPTDEESNEYILDLSFLSDLESHSEMLSGEMYSDALVDGAIEVVISRKAMLDNDMMVGDELYLADVLDQNGQPYKIRVTGAFQNSEENDAYWVNSPDSYSRHFFMDEDLFKELFVDYENPQYQWNSKWYTLVDYSNAKAEDAALMLETLDYFKTRVYEIDTYYQLEYFSEIIEGFILKQNKLTNVLFLLEVPIFILLIIFIFMVNNQMMQSERGDIAILKSRGASNLDIIKIYMLQGVFFSAIGLLLGIPLGMVLCRVLGNANAFLEFVSRTSIPMELTSDAIMVALICALVSLAISLVLASYHTKETIVSHKRKLNTSSKKVTVVGVIVGVVFMLTSAYSLYTFRNQADVLAQNAALGKAMDPLLFLGSIFFIIGAALIIQAILPVVVNIIFTLGKRLWGPSAYASLQQIIKGSSNQGFIILFIILTVALGIFDATLARTINGNEEDRITYTIGADLVVQEKWESNEAAIQAYITSLREMGQAADINRLDVYYEEPDFNRYTNLDGVEKATKVLVNDQVDISLSQGKVTGILMGINSKEFGEVAYLKESLTESHWYNYLNLLAEDENAIIVSSNFRDIHGYKIGDTLSFSDSNGSSRGIIKEFVDFWPSFAPVVKEIDNDGLVKELDNYLVVGNLSSIQSSWGITPYQVWIKAKDSTSFIYDFALENNIQFEVFKDLSAEIINKNNDPFYQGTNGVLTLGFIIILLICAIGFLIFWILSIISRELQFGVFRAMGMKVGEVIGMLLREQFFLSIIPIAGGLVIGNQVSKLFVPLIQIAYSSSEQVLPLEIIKEQGDQTQILVIVGIMVVVCMAIIGKLISDLKMTQALKLGED